MVVEEEPGLFLAEGELELILNRHEQVEAEGHCLSIAVVEEPHF